MQIEKNLTQTSRRLAGNIECFINSLHLHRNKNLNIMTQEYFNYSKKYLNFVLSCKENGHIVV